MTKVKMYSTRYCAYCSAARDLLASKGVSWEEIDAGDYQVRAEMTKLAGGRHTVPQIWIGDEHIGGYDEMRALDIRGQLDPKLGLASL